MQPFIRGDQHAPTGVLVAFAEVRGQNPLDPDGKFIAVHVSVSALSAHISHYPVVVFPPSSFRSRHDLDQVVEFIGNVDLIELEPFDDSTGASEDEYLQSRMDDFNRIVQEYVDLFQKRYSVMAKEAGIDLTSYSSITEILGDGEDMPLDLRSSLNELENLLEKKATIDQYRSVIGYIRSHHPELDVWNFEQLVRSSKLEVAALYVKKFKAIAEERYEAAAFYQNRILEADTDSPS